MLHPLPLGALVVLLLNDHWWKRAHPSFVTGKLSDVAGLIFFPLLLQAIVEIGQDRAGVRRGPSRRVLLVAIVATAVVFGLAKTWSPMNALVRTGDAALRWPLRAIWSVAHHRGVSPLGRSALVRDPSDLAALPAVLAGLGVRRRRLKDA